MNNVNISGRNKVFDFILGIISCLLLALLPAIILTAAFINFGSNPAGQYVLIRFIEFLVGSAVIVFIARKLIYKYSESKTVKYITYSLPVLLFVFVALSSFLNAAQIKLCKQYGGVAAYPKYGSRWRTKNFCYISQDNYKTLNQNKSDFKLLNFGQESVMVVSDPSVYKN